MEPISITTEASSPQSLAWVTTSLEIEYLSIDVPWANPHYRPIQCARNPADKTNLNQVQYKVYYLLDLSFWRWLIRSNFNAQKAFQAGKMAPDQGIEFTRFQSKIKDTRLILATRYEQDLINDCERSALSSSERIVLPKPDFTSQDLDAWGVPFPFTSIHDASSEGENAAGGWSGDGREDDDSASRIEAVRKSNSIANMRPKFTPKKAQGKTRKPNRSTGSGSPKLFS